MAELHHFLVEARAPLVCLYGPRTSGRTSLAQEFAEGEAHSFPGGIKWIQGGAPFPDGDGGLSPHTGEVSDSAPSLLILDDADLVPLSLLTAGLGELAGSGLPVGVLMTSVLPIHFREGNPSVELPPLSTDAVVDLLRRDAPVPSDGVERLALEIRGNPLLARLV